MSGWGPCPGLAPGDVVRLQLEAFRDSDLPEKDWGLRRAYAFNSPASKRLIGSVEDFIRLAHSDDFAPLLNHRQAQLGDLHLFEDEATQTIEITDNAGRTATYVFSLSLQIENGVEGCWMTDRVERIDSFHRPRPTVEQMARHFLN